MAFIKHVISKKISVFISIINWQEHHCIASFSFSWFKKKYKTLVKNFNNHYIKTGEKSRGTRPNVLMDNHNNFQNIINIIIEQKNHYLENQKKNAFNWLKTATDPFSLALIK